MEMEKERKSRQRERAVGNGEKAGVGDKRGVFGVMRAPLGLFCTNWHSR